MATSVPPWRPCWARRGRKSANDVQMEGRKLPPEGRETEVAEERRMKKRRGEREAAAVGEEVAEEGQMRREWTGGNVIESDVVKRGEGRRDDARKTPRRMTSSLWRRTKYRLTLEIPGTYSTG